MKTQDEKNAELLREGGKASFGSLVESYPLPFQLHYDLRTTLRALPALTLNLPDVPVAPWRFGQVVEDANALEFEYQTERKWVEFYLGFLEALIEYCNQTAFILVKPLQNRLQFRLVLA